MEFQNGNFEGMNTEAQAPRYTRQAESSAMEQQAAAPQATEKVNIFSKLFRTRIKVAKDDLPILNVSALFMIFSALSAIWLVVIGGLIALLLGYRFSIEKNSPYFSGEFKELVKDAGRNVKKTVDSFVE